MGRTRDKARRPVCCRETKSAAGVSADGVMVIS
jgi:hypothetical protein